MKRCLIIVDYQIDFITGSLGFNGAEALSDAIADKISLYRNSGDDVIFTFDTHDINYLNTQEGKNLPVVHCIKGTSGHKLHPKIEKLRQPNDRCFNKHTFGSAELFDYLRTHSYTSIELCGLVSNICVISNAVLCKTAQPETPVIVDARCTAGADKAMHNAAMLVMKGMHIQITGQEDKE